MDWLDYFDSLEEDNWEDEMWAMQEDIAVEEIKFQEMLEKENIDGI